MENEIITLVPWICYKLHLHSNRSILFSGSVGIHSPPFSPLLGFCLANIAASFAKDLPYFAPSDFTFPRNVSGHPIIPCFPHCFVQTVKSMLQIYYFWTCHLQLGKWFVFRLLQQARRARAYLSFANEHVKKNGVSRRGWRVFLRQGTTHIPHHPPPYHTSQLGLVNSAAPGMSTWGFYLLRCQAT